MAASRRELPRPARGFLGRSAAWAALDFWSQQLSSLLLLLLIGRLVGPAALGLMATAQIAVALLMTMLLDGLPDALVQRRRLTRWHVDTTFWLLLGLGCAAGAALALLALPAAWLFGEPALAELLWLLAPGLPLVGISAGLQGLLQRQMRFRLLALRSLAAQAGGLAAALMLAAQGVGVEALAVGFLVARLLDATILLACGARPGLALAWPALRQIVAYGRHRVGNQVVGFLVMQVDRVSIALLLGPAALGVFAVAERIATALVNGLSGVAVRAAFPRLAAEQAEDERFGRSLAMLMLWVNLLALPAFAGLAIVAEDLIVLLMDQRWAPAALPLALLALGGVPHAIAYVLATAANARGRPDLALRVNAQVALLRVITSFAAAPFGLHAVAAANLAVGILGILLIVRAVRPVVPGTMAALRQGLGLPLLATLVMVAAIAGESVLLPSMPPMPAISVEVATGIAAYGLAVLALVPATLRARLWTAALAKAGYRS